MALFTDAVPFIIITSFWIVIMIIVLGIEYFGIDSSLISDVESSTPNRGFQTLKTTTQEEHLNAPPIQTIAIIVVLSLIAITAIGTGMMSSGFMSDGDTDSRSSVVFDNRSLQPSNTSDRNQANRKNDMSVSPNESETKNLTDLDSDGDGLNNAIEQELGLDPQDKDTDGDGLQDGWEVGHGLNASDHDTDDDGLDDSIEVKHSLNPLTPDTDLDGLNDSVEYHGGTNASDPDTDNDGLTDRYEYVHNTSPTNSDSDDDELNDGDELANGTDPLDADTDSDNLLDGWEVRGEAPNNVSLPNADPLHKDIYVQVSKSDESLRFFERDRNIVKGEFNDMNVSNPDGEKGINVHFDTYPFSNPVRDVISDKQGVKRVLRSYSVNDYLGNVQGVGDRKGIYHHVMLVRIDDEARVQGLGEIPGKNVVVDESETGKYGGSIPYRDRLVISGLLQNIVGKPDPEFRHSVHSEYSTRGWLKYGKEDLLLNEYLSATTREDIENDGFAK